MTARIVIPARMASTRFPGKPLAQVAGMTMIERVWRIASAVQEIDQVLIATDDCELAASVEEFGATVVMTSKDCRNGTERVAEACQDLSGEDSIVCNLQGDAVLTPPWVISRLLEAISSDTSIHIATPAVKLEGASKSDFLKAKRAGSSSGTCVTFDKQGSALYFSKALIPYDRSGEGDADVFQHIGLYAYRADALHRFVSLPAGNFELIEQLEQLRALEYGIAIKVVQIDYRGRTPASIDLPEDVAYVENLIEREGELVF